MSKMPPAILPKSNLRSLFDSLIVFQPGGRCLVSYAHEIGPLNFECGIRRLGAGTPKETTDLSTKIVSIWASGVIGVEESTHQERKISPKLIGDRVRGTSNDTEITACPNGSYCCGKNAADCCNANEGKFIVNNQVSDTAARDSLSSQTSQTTAASSTPISIQASEFMSTTTSGMLSAVVQTSTVQASVLISTVYQPLPSSTLTASSSNTPQSLSIGARAGIGAGAGVFTVLVSLLALLLWKRKQPGSKSHELPATEIKPSLFNPGRRPKHVDRVEVDGTTPRAVEVHEHGRQIEPTEML
ncbi:hypothetical protein H4I95_05915 [Botrytis cinerea]